MSDIKLPYKNNRPYLIVRIYQKIMFFVSDVVWKSSNSFIKRWKCVARGEHEYYPHGKMIMIPPRSGNQKHYIHKLKCIHCGNIINSQKYTGSERCHRNEMLEAGLN